MKRIIVLLLLGFTFIKSVYSFTLSIDTNHVRINGSAAAALDVSPASPDDYTYEWSANIGNISGSGVNVTYNAPATKGIATISVDIKEGVNTVGQESVRTLVYKQFIIMKGDDMGFANWLPGSNYVRVGWKEYLDYMEYEAYEKSSLGLMTGTLEAANATYKNYLIDLAGSGYFELWHHGHLHENFTTFTAQEQLDLLTLGNNLSESELGITLYGFGSPGNKNNADTVWAMNQRPEKKYYFFGPAGFNGMSFVNSALDRIMVETAEQHIDYAMYLTEYAASVDEKCQVIQMHPPGWQNDGPGYYDLTEWDKIIQHLKSEGVTNILPYEYYRLLNEPAYIPPDPGDTTPPADISNVNDGTGPGPDIDSTSLTTELSANWTASSDPENGISRYDYCIGTSPGDTNIVDWASTSNGTVRSVTESGFSLTVGVTYYFTVKAVNGIGLESNPISSDGQLAGEGSGLPGDDINVKVYPNPFSSAKGNFMSFSIDSTGGGEVRIYTISGKLVKKLQIGAGESEVDWDVLNEEGNSITAGLYMYSVTDAEENKKTGKIVIIQ
jgi:hypothetical protein